VHNKFIDSPQDLEGKKLREKPPKPTAFLNLKFPKRKKNGIFSFSFTRWW
jgi:hypothetical protein